MICEFCSGDSFVPHEMREMMFGFRDEFQYLECRGCGCLRIASIPRDLGKYYPPETYYAYSVTINLRTRLRRLLLTVAVRNRWLCRVLGSGLGLPTLEWVTLFGLDRGMKILDVGSGGALFVRDLRATGFKWAMGVDPFVEKDIKDEFGLAVKKAYLSEIDGGWDRITFQHSLEHIADQIGALELARSKLSRRGTCIVRIPVANWAWEHYGANWVQLDPPRHLCIHTEKSFRMAASKAGLNVVKVIYDSTDFQFWASELYQQGIPLKTGMQELAGHCSPKERRHFRQRAGELNRQGRGDQAMFFLEPQAEASDYAGIFNDAH